MLPGQLGSIQKRITLNPELATYIKIYPDELKPNSEEANVIQIYGKIYVTRISLTSYKNKL